MFWKEELSDSSWQNPPGDPLKLPSEVPKPHVHLLISKVVPPKKFSMFIRIYLGKISNKSLKKDCLGTFGGIPLLFTTILG